MIRPLLFGLLLLPLPIAPARSQTAVDAPTAALTARDTRALRDPASTAAEGAAVVTAADPRAAAAGAEMLRQGGSAADAAAATLLALNVVEPQSSGLGGGGFLVYHDAASNTDWTVDGREKAPAAARANRFLDTAGHPRAFGDVVWGGISVGVPGNLRLVEAMHRRWGKLPWAALFQPAIRLADGMTASPRLVHFIASRRAMVAASTNAPQLLPGGQLPAGGQRIAQPDLAATLRQIAAQGPGAFYAGPFADALIATVGNSPRNPAVITRADLADYQVREAAPVCGVYRGYRLCGMPPESSGGIAVLAILRQLERFDLRKLGPDNPLAWHLIAESERLAYADREAWLADPDFVPVPTAGLLDPAYVRGRGALIRIDRAMAHVDPGTPAGAPPRTPVHDNEVAGTSSFAVADRAGDVASLTSTVESVFGSGLAVRGVVLNNELTDFDRDVTTGPNRVEPGKRPRSSMAPFLVYAPGGRLVAAVGAAGGATIIAQVAKTLIAIIDWRLPVEQALAAPVLFTSGDTVVVEKGSRLEGMIPALKALGHASVVSADLPTKTNALVRTGNRWRGAGDPRTEGQAVAE